MKKFILLLVCAMILTPVLLFGLPCAVCNYMNNHNVNYVDEDGTVFASKMDGPFTYTEIRYCAAIEECSPKGLNVKKKTEGVYVPFSETRIREYTDLDMDGKVDELKMSIHSNYITLKREKNYRTHRKYFDEADADLKKQMKRFRKHI